MDAGERDAGRSSRLKPLLGGAAMVALVGVALAALGVRPTVAPQGAGLPVLLPNQAPAATQRASQSDEAPRQASPRGSAEERDRTAGARSAQRDDVKPEVAVQVFDTQEGRCPKTFDVGVNAYVVKGRIDEGFAELRVPADRIRRSRQMLEISGDFSAIIYSVPTKRTATLQLLFRGPAGEVTEVHDITHPCPGKPLDQKKNKGTWGQLEKLAGPKSDMDFEFDFSPKGGETASGAPTKPSPTADRGDPGASPAPPPPSRGDTGP